MDQREVIPLKQGLDFKLTLPGSKSITNRAFLCAVLAKGKTKIHGALKSDDTTVMLNALRKLKIPISKSKNCIEIEGSGGTFKAGNITVNAGASGTTTRFLTALAVLRKGKTIIEGTKRMKERPIKDLKDALDQLNNGEKVIRIKGNKSSQFLSALLMISPFFGPLEIEVAGELVSKPYIDMTIAVMQAFGVKVKNNDYQSFIIKPQEYKATEYRAEGDASAASYWVAMVDLHGGKLDLENLNLNKSIQGDSKFPSVVPKLGKGTIDMNDMPDVAMTAAVLAPFKKGQTKITGLSTLRIKETDRLAALEKELKKVGVKVKTTKDSIAIVGSSEFGVRSHKTPNSKLPTPISTYNDHRMAMCFAVMGTKIPGIVIENPGCVDKTYPLFWEDLELAYLLPIKLKQKNLILTGMRCTGKTRHGKKIAKLLGRKFVDLDVEIEKDQKMTIPKIVKRYGWPYFRKTEQKICTKFADAKNLVIGTGGGVILNPKNMRALRKNGVNVFIFTDLNAIAERIKHKSGTRPSLTGKHPVKEIHDVWLERRDLYLKYADFVWDNTSGKVLQENLKNILQS